MAVEQFRGGDDERVELKERRRGETLEGTPAEEDTDVDEPRFECVLHADRFAIA
jgi:hypothetical protein